MRIPALNGCSNIAQAGLRWRLFCPTGLRCIMPDEKQIACPKCKCDATVQTKGHLELIQCYRCGWSQTSTVFPESDVGLIDKSHELMNVQINWSSQSETGKQVAIARQLFDQLGDMPLEKVLKLARESQTFSLGTFPMPIAIDIEERAKANGISVLFVKIEPATRAE